MDLRPCSLLLLWTLLVAFVLLAQEVLAQRIYTNTWAVLVPAGPQEADRLARKHGFLNLGPVSPSLPSPHSSCVPAGSAPAGRGWAQPHCRRVALPGGLGPCACAGSLQPPGTHGGGGGWMEPWPPHQQHSLVARHGTACSVCWRWKEKKPISGRGSWESCMWMEEGRAPNLPDPARAPHGEWCLSVAQPPGSAEAEGF